MSTTVVRQRTTRFPGKVIAMALAGLAMAAAIGYGVANIDDSSQVSVAGDSVGSADQAFLNQAAELTSERQNLLNQATKLTESPAVAGPGVGAIVVPEIEFGGLAAPTWQPNWGAIESVRPDRHWFGQTPPSATPDIDTGGLNNTEPFGNPNYGRLDTYLGSEPTSGPR